jgi:Notch-like protein
LTSNSACSGFLSTCITTGAGCITNTTCSSAAIQAACVSNASGTTCIWDTTCKEKTCVNAPAANNSYTLCTAYLSTCTVNASSNGCTNRTCINAPTFLVSNTDCETYLPNSKCITKSGGGCITNTTCAAITIQGACVADANGTDCFWDPSGAGSCKDRTCFNAPSIYTDDAACSSFLKTCTVSSSGAGCVNRICENLLTSALCTTDLNNKPCIYKGLCYMK